VTDVEASLLLFNVNWLGVTCPRRYDEDAKVHVAQVDPQDCALIRPAPGRENWQRSDVHFPEGELAAREP
jgi:hypothetical protein